MAAPDFNAEYQNTLAGIQLAEEKGLEGIGHPAENGLPATGKYKSSEEVFNEGQEAQKANEPGTYRGIDARSNRGGILTSGFESRRVHGQEGVFERQAKQRLGSRTRAERGYGEQRGNLVAEQAQRRLAAQNQLYGNQRQYALENPELKLESAPVLPGQQAAINAGSKAGPGGVVPYESTYPGGFVRVGGKPRPKAKNPYR